MAKKNDLKEKLGNVKGRVAHLEHVAEDKILEHPIKSVAVAFGIGFAAGALVLALARRK